MFSLISYSMFFLHQPHKFTPDLCTIHHICCNSTLIHMSFDFSSSLAGSSSKLLLVVAFQPSHYFLCNHENFCISSSVNSANLNLTKKTSFACQVSKIYFLWRIASLIFWQVNPDIKNALDKTHPPQKKVFGNLFKFSQSYHLPIFTFSTLNFRFQREIKFHTFTICSELNRLVSRLDHRNEYFFLPYTQRSESGENKLWKSTSQRLEAKTVERILKQRQLAAC